MKVSNARKKVVALVLIVAIIALSSGLYFRKIKADTMALGTKVQLTDLSGKDVKSAVMLEMLVFGTVRVCQTVKLAGIKINQCSNQERAYTRYAATDENGIYIVPSNIGKPLSDTELRDTLQKVVFTSGQSLESDDVQDIIDSVKNIKIDDNPTFLMQAVQVVGSAYAAKFASDLVTWTSTQIGNIGKAKVPATPTKPPTVTPPPTTTTPAPTTTTPAPTTTTPAPTTTTTPIVTGSAENAVSEIFSPPKPLSVAAAGENKAGSSPQGLSADLASTKSSVNLLSSNPSAIPPKISPTASVADVEAASVAADNSSFAHRAVATQQMGLLTSEAGIKAGKVFLDAATSDSKTLLKLNTYIGEGQAKGQLVPQNWNKNWGQSNWNDYYTKASQGYANPEILRRVAVDATSATASNQILLNDAIKKSGLSTSNNVSSYYGSDTNAPYKMSDSAIIANVLRESIGAAASTTVATAFDNAANAASQKPEFLPSFSPNLTVFAASSDSGTPTGNTPDTKTPKKKSAIKSAISGIFKSVVQSSLTTGNILIPDPVSLGIALVYQAIGPKYSVIERDFVPSNAVVSTLSERFDSGRIRIDFPASGASKDTESSGSSTGVLQYFNLNKSSSTATAKKLQVVFRDEAVYNNTTVSFLAKAFSTTTDAKSQDYMTKTLGNYKDYLLETQLRGSADADANTAINDNIKKIGNLVCPATTTPATATTATTTP